ncbi:hypothetical protein CY0110_18967 [Crocosphaera chwakensis CCY0110]|uniref:Uncharacterized protein n=1 Tax=Crocosphaera chwakensis CCY0110 TaxID=391612 RepID=A3IJC5_9CHRO|nr:hypothetical protein CY0110_18967 [Crocosphaera chwakensis CCY0110]
MPLTAVRLAFLRSGLYFASST